MSTKQIHFTISTRALFGALCFVAGGLMMSVGASFADNNTSTQSILGADLIMPYDGFLMIDSTPLTGTRTIKFDLYQSDDAAATAVWSETQNVETYNGRFSVGLGSTTSLTNTILDAEKLYLGMTIIDTDAQGNAVEVELSGRQAIEPAPFAAWSGNSADFAVRGALAVAGIASFNSDTTIESADSNGARAPLAIKTVNSTQALYLDGNEIDAATELYINTNSKSPVNVGGDFFASEATILGNASSDTVTIKGTMTVEQDLTLGNDKDIKNVDIINGYNDIRWRANASDTSDDMKLESDGDLAVYNDLTVSGTTTAGGALQVNGGTTLGNASSDDTTIKGDLTVDGDITNFSMSGEYRVASGDGDGTNLKSGSGYCMSGTQRNPASSCSNSSTGSAYNLGSTSNKICFLTGTGFEDIDSNGERGFCNVYVSGSNWYLAANTDTGDANMWCNARCLSW